MEYEQNIAIKLQDPTTSSKEYWHLTKMVYGNKVKCGIPSIIEAGEVFWDAETKANLFNEHFLKKSQLPDVLPDLTPFEYVTEARLTLFMLI